MTRRPLLVTLLALALLVTLAGCRSDGGGGSAEGARPVQVVLDWYPNADHMGLYGAVREGYLAAEGLDVRVRVPSDPAAALKQVGAGRVPFAVSYEPEVLLARAQGVPVVAVGALVGVPLNSVMVRADRGIARPRDLEGKTVGIAGLPSDRPLLDTVVRDDGGDPAAVRTRNVGFNLAPALAAGKVDALVGAYWNIEAPELERRGVPVEAFRLEEHGVPSYDELVLVTSDEVARDDPALVRAFLRGLRQGQDWAAADQTGATAHLLEASPDLERELLQEQVRLTAELVSPDDGSTLAVDPEAWAAYADWMRAGDLLDPAADVTGAVTDRFLPQEES